MSLLKELTENLNYEDSMSPDDTLPPSPGGEMGGEMGGSFEPDVDQHNGLVRFFADNETLTDEDVHAFAEEQGMFPEEVEEQIYQLLHDLIKSVGKHNEVPDEEFDPEQLARGVEIEKEHTSNELVAKMIAKDHLAEFPDYYTRLDDMEAQARGSEGPEISPNDNNEVDFKIGG